MKTALSQDRRFLTGDTRFLEYGDTEIEMLDIGEALLISELKLRFAVPVRLLPIPNIQTVSFQWIMACLLLNPL